MDSNGKSFYVMIVWNNIETYCIAVIWCLLYSMVHMVRNLHDNTQQYDIDDVIVEKASWILLVSES